MSTNGHRRVVITGLGLVSPLGTTLRLGNTLGGSGLWFRDRLRALATYGEHFEPAVIGIDIEIRKHNRDAIERVFGLAPGGHVVEMDRGVQGHRVPLPIR